MCGSEDGTEKDAHTTDSNVCNTQEVVATAHDGTGGDKNGLGTLIFDSREVYQVDISTSQVQIRVSFVRLGQTYDNRW